MDPRIVSEQWRASFQWTIPAPLQTVWRLTSDFVAVHKWAPSVVVNSTILDGAPQQPGCVRYLEGPPRPDVGSPVRAKERLLSMDVENFNYKYEIVDCTIPIFEGIVATFQLADLGKDTTEITWSCEVAPVAGLEEENFQSAIKALYETCIADLKKTLSIEV